MAVSEKFEFPDDAGTDGPNKKKEMEDKLEIEVLDDTPADDKNRDPLPKEVVEDLEKDDLKEYGEKVQNRLKTLKKAYHDERRAKETSTRERDEATRFAQTQLDENKTLKQRLGTGEKIFITEVTAAAKAALENARVKLKQANASGDADLITQAQEEMTDAKLKIREVESFKPSLQEDKSGVNNNPQPQTPARPASVEPKADAWRAKNGWFGVDKKMTALALGLHEELVDSGVDPRSDDYYKKIDADMKKRFPEYFEGDEPARDSSSRKHTTIVATASRSTGPRRVQLTTSQVALAKRLGLTNEAYARELMKLEEVKHG